MPEHGKLHIFSCLLDLGDINLMGESLQSRYSQKIFNRFRRFSEPVHKFFQHILILFLRFDSCDPLINIQFLIFIRNIFWRNKGVQFQIYCCFKFLLLTDAFGFFYRLIQHFTIEVVAHCLHMAMLLCAQQVACAPDFQIPHGNLKSAAQICKFPDGMKPFLRYLFQHFISPVHEEGIGGSVRTSYPAPKLIQLGKSHLIRVMDDHGISIGDVQSSFYNGSRNQDINIAVNKAIHDLFQLVLPHLSVGKGYICLRYQFRDPVGDLFNIIYPVVYIIHLSPSCHFSGDGFPDQFLVIFHHIGLDGHSVHRSFFQYTHIPDPDQAHMKGSGNGRGSQGKDIYVFF